MTDRWADIHMEQGTDGYWSGRVTVKVATSAEALTFEASTLHNASEAFEWARIMVESVVAHA